MKNKRFFNIKNTITLSVALFLLYNLLAYCGFFRDNSNPVAVAEYYWDCLGSREGFLTYHISTGEFFNEDKQGGIYEKYKMNLIKKIEQELLEKNNDYSKVRVKFIYKDNTVAYVDMELEKRGKSWLIRGIE